ncbi:MAG: hypothetical protein R3E98_19735 [Gemmatimonadota bacterium]
MSARRWILRFATLALFGAAPAAGQELPQEPGQAAFAAIAEIVSLLEADPATDWSRVDIDALREHLVDMDRVTLGAVVRQRPLPNGVEMSLSGSTDVMASARRMVQAHTAMVSGAQGTSASVADRGDVLVVTWTTSRPDEVDRLRGLGFFGFLAEGNHHRMHHLMIARGADPHGHQP